MLASTVHPAYFLAISSPFSLIGTAWAFGKKQPALKGVAFWFFLIPGALMNIFSTLMDWNESGDFLGFTEAQQDMAVAIAVVGILVLAVVMLWGGACVLLIGKKLVHSRAGRNRTSLAAVAREGHSFILPLLLTQLLRTCFTLLWTLLLVIPGIIYSLRTIFNDIIVVTEDTAYRGALKRSKDVVRGNLWAMTWRMVAIFLLVYGIPNLVSFLGYLAVDGLAPASTLVMDVIDAALNAPATILALLSMMVLFDELKSRA